MSPVYISKDGVWFAGKEKVGLKDKNGIPYIYEGADRAALYEFYKAGVSNFGEDFRNNPDFLQSIRNRGFTSVKKFLEFIGYDEKKVEENFENNASKINLHELPEAIKRVEKLGGGVDTSGGGQDKTGGFGPAPKG